MIVERRAAPRTSFPDTLAHVVPPVPDDVSALVVMGISGCGKSTVGKACAERLGWRFIEGDDYHDESSIAKMHAGIALTDADRDGWLERLAQVLRTSHAQQQAGAAGGIDAAARPASADSRLVLPCSALRNVYRDRLRAASPGLRFLFLELDHEEARRRVTHRPGHFFAPQLLDSQFATLESPTGEPGVLTVDARLTVDALAAQAVAWLTAR